MNFFNEKNLIFLYRITLVYAASKKLNVHSTDVIISAKEKIPVDQCAIFTHRFKCHGYVGSYGCNIFSRFRETM